ncbi:MAG: hypothetical protein ABSB89_05825 [Candidatus Bathyarchaeia archaeon]
MKRLVVLLAVLVGVLCVSGIAFLEFYVFGPQMPTLVVQAENDAKITIKGNTLYLFYDPFPFKNVSGSLNVSWPGGIDRQLDSERNSLASCNQSGLVEAWFPPNSTFGPYGSEDGVGVQNGTVSVSFDDAFSYRIVNANSFNITLAFSSQTFTFNYVLYQLKTAFSL